MESGDNRQTRFEDLVLTHWGDLYRIALGIGYDRDSAERLVHVTLLAGADNLAQFKTPSEAKLWLLKLMVRFPAEALCNEAQGISADPAHVHSRSTVSPLSDDEPGPLLVRVHQALQQLLGERRLILVLAILDGRSCEEIAALLRISGSVVTRELALGLIQFHTCMDKGRLETSSDFKEVCHFDR